MKSGSIKFLLIPARKEDFEESLKYCKFVWTNLCSFRLTVHYCRLGSVAIQ
jgi:hypothetical protein